MIELKTSTQAYSQIKSLEPVFTKDIFTIGLAKQTNSKIRTYIAKDCKIIIDSILITSMDRDLQIIGVKGIVKHFAALERK